MSLTGESTLLTKSTANEASRVKNLGGEISDAQVPGVIGERITLEAFAQLSGSLAGISFVKIVVDREDGHKIHFINDHFYKFHCEYIAEQILNTTKEDVNDRIDSFNHSLYMIPDRRFFIGVLGLQKRDDKRFFSLETVEVDNMDLAMIQEFYNATKAMLDLAFPLFFKPANHDQEIGVQQVDSKILPRVFAHEIFSKAKFIVLNPGTAEGRIRAFRSELEYRSAQKSLEWFDIIVMHRVPDDIPRVSGIINAHFTTPLSHTNVLSAGWKIPNSIQIGIFDRISAEKLDGKWVRYHVDTHSAVLTLEKLDDPKNIPHRPTWSMNQIKLEEPEILNTPILPLSKLRMSDRYKYGTKAANLGELNHVLENGSERLLGFYKIKRPPRANLLPYLSAFLHAGENANLARSSHQFIKNFLKIPRGIAIPFSLQQQFLESSPRIQQAIGRLKMALELEAVEIDSLCVTLQKLIRQTRMPESVRNYIDSEIANELAGVSSFVIRSSSNAEDLDGFSAAGIYESINHVTTAENLFESIKEVWASLLSPRSVRLREQVQISLDDCYMGVIVQEEVPGNMGGVMVTTNPMNRADFRNVYINVSAKSVTNIVQGSELPLQYLYNTVEGGGRTLSIGDAKEDLPHESLNILQTLAVVGRLLQSHFSPDYTFSAPVDIEWLVNEDGVYMLQLRPYAK